MARSGDHFAISDLSSFYFGDGEGERRDGGRRVHGRRHDRIHLHRPARLPACAEGLASRAFSGRAGDRGYEIPTGNVVVTIEDPNSGKSLKQRA